MTAGSPPFAPPRRVAITGAAGNLGQKLIDHLLAADWCEGILAIDRVAPASSSPRVSAVIADLADAGDGRWHDALARADGLVHLAAQNPYPNASWDDAAVSLDMTLNLAQVAARCGVRRLVFASSNHVMGRYKDPPLADGLPPGGLTTDLTPAPGTRYFDGHRRVEDDAYAVAKLMGERVMGAAARHSAGALSAVSLRIGWCQPGDNRPQTLNPAGLPEASVGEHGDARDLAWFRNMWLSNRDFAAVMACALTADPAAWPAPAIVVNAMSANAGMPWDVATTRERIGYRPKDDVWRELGGQGPI